MIDYEDVYRQELEERRRSSLERRREPRAPSRLPVLRLRGRRLVGFASNDYLGLATDPRVSRVLAKAARRWGVGSSAASTLGGYSEAQAVLEASLAKAVGRPRALVFSTGYMANLGVVGAFVRSRRTRVYADRLDHASILDAIRLTGARLHRYPHGDMAALSRSLAETQGDTESFIVSESVFSMEGDRAPIAALVERARAAHALLMIDDAHGFGILGPRGAGVVAEGGWNPDEIPLYVATLGKALGVFGAFVAGTETIIEILVQKARTALFTTCLPPALCDAASAALALLREEEWRRRRLAAHVARFRRGLVERGLPPSSVDGPIQPILTRTAERALTLSTHLEKAGYHVPAIRPPTVPPGAARLRISLSALHEEHEIDGLLDALASGWKRLEDEAT